MKLNFIKLGEGKPLIILHGLFGMLDNWITLGKRFSENFEVYLVDQRNHGKSPHDFNHNYTYLCEDLDEFIKSNNISSPWIIGHSMGGKTAMNYALNFNAEIEGLIIVDISPRRYNIHHLDIFDALKKIDISKINSRTEASTILANEGVSFHISQFLLKNLERIDKDSFRWKFNLDALINNMENIGANITNDKGSFIKPSLFLKGENSNYIKEEDFALISSLFPNSQITTIPNSGHWLHAEQPDLFFQHVFDYIAKK